MRLTKTTVRDLRPPERGYTIHRDDRLRGFGVLVTENGAKTFILERRIRARGGRVVRGKLGRVGDLSVEQARRKAERYIGVIADGGDPFADERRHEMEGVTLNQAFEAYLERRPLKPRTVRDMREALANVENWKSKTLMTITAEMVTQKHKELGQRSQARANLAMRYIRAIFNFAMSEYTSPSGEPILTRNPVRRLSETRGWYRVERRQTVIKPHQLGTWVQAVSELHDRTERDYLMFVLLTGLRKSEALGLRWNEVDLEGRELTIADTKARRPHTLPLSDFLCELLERRMAEAKSELVFSDLRGIRMREPQAAVDRVVAASGVEFCLHDLRRTFATVAESLDIPAYALKRLLNHATAADVTAGYIVADVERLRVPMQKITDSVLMASGVRANAEVVTHSAATARR
jgi:integrase